MQIKIHNLSKVTESVKNRISQSLVWQIYTQIKFELNLYISKPLHVKNLVKS